MRKMKKRKEEKHDEDGDGDEVEDDSVEKGEELSAPRSQRCGSECECEL